MPILRTKRLTLRPLARSDRDALVATVMADRDVMHWLPGADEVSTALGQRIVASEYLKEFISPWKKLGFGVWAVCSSDAQLGRRGDFLGYCGFIAGQIEAAGPEMAYAVGRSMWGRGVASEAAIASLDWIYSKPDISRVYAVSDNGNKASRSVLEKVGMKHEKDVDLYDSVAKGEGLLPFYALQREAYLLKRSITNLKSVSGKR